MLYEKAKARVSAGPPLPIAPSLARKRERERVPDMIYTKVTSPHLLSISFV